MPMFNQTQFIRTFKGEELLIQTNVAAIDTETQTVLRLCDGKFAYDFLKLNVKHVQNFSQIIQSLLYNHCITELTNESLKNFHLNRALLGHDNIERRSSNRTLAGNSDYAGTSLNQQTSYKQAISILNNALIELDSEQLSSWLAHTETCNNEGEFNQLLDNFRAIYSKLTSHDKASEIIRTAIKFI